MAKFGRYDPRNKKRDRHKSHSQNGKDFKIRDVEENRDNFKIKVNSSIKDILNEFDDEEIDLDLK